MTQDEWISYVADAKALLDGHLAEGTKCGDELIKAVSGILNEYICHEIEQMQKPVPMTFEEWCEAVAMCRTTHDMNDTMAVTLCKAFGIDPTEPHHRTLLKFLSFNANHERYPHGFVVHMQTREHPNGKEYSMDRAGDVYDYMCDIFRDEP